MRNRERLIIGRATRAYRDVEGGADDDHCTEDGERGRDGMENDELERGREHDLSRVRAGSARATGAAGSLNLPARRLRSCPVRPPRAGGPWSAAPIGVTSGQGCGRASCSAHLAGEPEDADEEERRHPVPPPWDDQRDVEHGHAVS